VGRGWTRAGELLAGDLLLTKDGRAVRVDLVGQRKGQFRVYNFEVAGAHTYYVSTAGLLVHNKCWPDTPEKMDDFLGMKGTRIPDGPTTPGRGKVEWQPSENVKITFEQHPYHPNAPAWHRGPHWHLDTPAATHARYLPGDPIF
jgi:hypothetical protein